MKNREYMKIFPYLFSEITGIHTSMSIDTHGGGTLTYKFGASQRSISSRATPRRAAMSST